MWSVLNNIDDKYVLDPAMGFLKAYDVRYLVNSLKILQFVFSRVSGHKKLNPINHDCSRCKCVVPSPECGDT